MRKLTILLLVTACITAAFAAIHPSSEKDSSFVAAEDAPSPSDWVEEQLSGMTLEQKVAQLIMIEAYSNRGPEHKAEISSIIEKYGIGGIMFKQGGPVVQAQLTNHFQSISTVPMLIALDAEWGLSMRLDSTFSFPWMMTQGAVTNDSTTYAFGAELAAHCRRIGVNVNFAPDADVNSNPNNPIINTRSFGENREVVARKSIMYMKGMQDNGVLACAKHFPGHGDTDKDSHKTLPTILKTKEEMDSIELYPFRALIDSGVGSVMIAHLNIPAYGTTNTRASSLTKSVVTDLLQEQMNFDGLIFTDGLNMKAVSQHYGPGQLEVEALRAGNDVLLLPADVEATINAVVLAVNKGLLTVERIERSVRKVLKAKYELGLHNWKPVSLDGIYEDLNTVRSEKIYRDIIRQAQTVIKNKDVLPIKKLDETVVMNIRFEEGESDDYAEMLNRYTKVTSMRIHDQSTPAEIEAILKRAEEADILILSVHKSNASPWKSYKLSERTVQILNQLANRQTTVLNLFANPYALRSYKGFRNHDAIVLSYQNSRWSQDYATQVIFGAIEPRGVLPVSIDSEFSAGTTLGWAGLDRLKYGIPEDENIDHSVLAGIDAIAQQAVDEGATPGCQVLVAKNGNVIYNKAFGYHTYQKKNPVHTGDLYDLASITKVAASVPALMVMYEDGFLNLDRELGDYFPQTVGTNKEKLIIREMLAHQARLYPWIPFYRDFLKEQNQWQPEWIYSDPKRESKEVANRVYMKEEVSDSILNRILSSDLLANKQYRYSDLGYYLLQSIIESYFQTSLDSVAYQKFYAPLGATTLGYRPLKRFPPERITPTENDLIFRKQLIHGYVHDQGAAMLGGVAGHAGLFSNSNDLAKLMQMYMQYGYYGGEQFIDSSVVAEFTRCQFCESDNRRGIGFDKPVVNGRGGPTCNCVSLVSFGHSGFTGTLAWVDPEQEIVYIFLSNRIHPDAENRKLISTDVRTRIQEVIYNSLNSYQFKYSNP